jgi:lipopolysaccharide assembly outer membrane protein LptD (OstA)
MTMFDHDKKGNRWSKVNTWNSSLGLGSTFYGTFLPQLGALEGIRHVVKPTASWTYRPEFDKYDRDDYDRIGGIGAPTLTGQSSMNLGLSNMFHLKLRDGEEVRKLDNVVQLTSNTTYDFRYEENNKEDPWGNLSSQLVIQPTRAFDLRANAVHDPNDGRLLSRSFTSSLKLTGLGWSLGTDPSQDRSVVETSTDQETEDHLSSGAEGYPSGGGRATEPWRLNLSYRYTKQQQATEATQWLNADLTTHITPKWKLVYGNRYDLAKKEIAYQKFTLHRDMHCWEARVSGEYSNESWTYYFKINIKAHPELYVERGARRVGGGGSIGGF